jgi:hypothetical protein
VSLAALTAVLALGGEALAEPEAEKQPEEKPVKASPTDPDPRDDVFDSRLVLDDGRVPLPEATKTGFSFALRGESQLRFRANSDLDLEPPIGAAAGVGETLGQNYYLYHWARLRPVFLHEDTLKIYGEIDLPRGLVAGDTTQFVSATRDDLADVDWYDVHPRQLYIQYKTPIGIIRLGQQASHWGMGVLANDGDHSSLFGDYRRGTLTERLLFATRPMGEGTPLAVALAGDLIFEDARATLVDGDRAFQGIAAVRWETPRFEIGIYGVVRHQERDQKSVDVLTPFTEELTVGIIDVATKFNAPVPGASAFLYGELEAAFIAGSTTMVRNIDLTAAGDTEDIVSFGGAANLGIVTVAKSDSGRRWGDLAVEVEFGYASGDADPYDGVTRRFTMDQNHNVGMVLFDHVLQWKTARSATIAQDPAIVNRPAPGLQFLASEGSVFGAQYLNPTVVVRPQHWMDLKGGMVIARTTADFVDPFRAGAEGNYANYEGGEERRRDLGLELDAGFDFRIHATETFVINTGAEGGVLFPGQAFEDENGATLGTQYLLNTKLGLYY